MLNWNPHWSEEKSIDYWFIESFNNLRWLNKVSGAIASNYSVQIGHIKRTDFIQPYQNIHSIDLLLQHPLIISICSYWQPSWMHSLLSNGLYCQLRVAGAMLATGSFSMNWSRIKFLQLKGRFLTAILIIIWSFAWQLPSQLHDALQLYKYAQFNVFIYEKNSRIIEYDW